MVQLMKSGNRSLEPDMASLRDKVPVKLEIEDSLEEEHAPFSKRPKTATTFSPVRGIGFSSAWSEKCGAGGNFFDPWNLFEKMNVLFLTYEDEHLS